MSGPQKSGLAYICLFANHSGGLLEFFFNEFLINNFRVLLSEYEEKGVYQVHILLDKTYPLEESMHISSFVVFSGCCSERGRQRKFYLIRTDQGSNLIGLSYYKQKEIVLSPIQSIWSRLD